MRNLQHVKRFLGFTGALVFAVCLLLPHAPAAAPVAASRPALSFDWTQQLAHRFHGCQAHIQGVASAFVVERLDGSIERMAFDETWRRTHDRQQADDVWVLGQCR